MHGETSARTVAPAPTRRQQDAHEATHSQVQRGEPANLLLGELDRSTQAHGMNCELNTDHATASSTVRTVACSQQ